MKNKKDYGLLIFLLVAFVIPIGASIVTGLDFESFAPGYYTGVVVTMLSGMFLSQGTGKY